MHQNRKRFAEIHNFIENELSVHVCGNDNAFRNVPVHVV